MYRLSGRGELRIMHEMVGRRFVKGNPANYRT